MGFRRAKLLSPKAVVGISVLCMLALLPDPSSLLSDHVDAALRESAKGKDIVREIGPSYFFHTKKEKKGCLLSFQCHCPINAARGVLFCLDRSSLQPDRLLKLTQQDPRNRIRIFFSLFRWGKAKREDFRKKASSADDLEVGRQGQVPVTLSMPCHCGGTGTTEWGQFSSHRWRVEDEEGALASSVYDQNGKCSAINKVARTGISSRKDKGISQSQERSVEGTVDQGDDGRWQRM
ncbi:hypothetical protein RJ640_028998 [Escallonia rubra]|uniref:Uncharacterized protein n=1 Tax=Escallonia rubra TaxID=112253 RepID=A0AA88SA76_9ASTE|nr:hypothetical protein RJ640_028998 [Escallonia rubra]